MGQCSSNTKSSRSSGKQYDAPLDEEEDAGVVAPPRPAAEASSNRRARKALDGDARSDAPVLTAAVTCGSRDASSRQVEEFNLAALRPSVDDTTCTALLALRMGRGSSVSGLMNGSKQSIEMRTAGGSLVTTMDPLPEDASVLADSGTVEVCKSTPEAEQQMMGTQVQQSLGPPRNDSSERLVSLMMAGGGDARAPVLPSRA